MYKITLSDSSVIDPSVVTLALSCLRPVRSYHGLVCVLLSD